MKTNNEELQLSDFQKYIDKINKKFEQQNYKSVIRNQINSRSKANRHLEFMYTGRSRGKIGG